MLQLKAMKKRFVENLISRLPSWTYILASVIVISIPIGYGSLFYYKQYLDLENTKQELATTKETLGENIKNLQELLSISKSDNEVLLSNLTNEQAKNLSYEQQIQSISSTVGLLYKLSKTDRELLQKYSNVYFLNENYVPDQLSDINPDLLLRRDKIEKIHTNIKPHLELMLKDSNEASIPILVFSGYRSFDTQTSLKAGYKVTYGSGANKFSADQGYSEHQLGSTVDLTTPKTMDNLNAFEKTSAYSWLIENSYKYGFILSYPKGNKFYQFEPWHWRFVGVELATKLHNENKFFYDLDQRVINEYLVKIFD